MRITDIFKTKARSAKTQIHKLAISFTAAAAIFVATPPTATADESRSPAPAATALEGLWLVHSDDAVIDIKPCPPPNREKLCGTMHWTAPGSDDYAKNGEPLCGLQLIRGLTQEQDAPYQWAGGKIYHAEWGKTFNISFEAASRNRAILKVMLMKKKWKRVSKKDYPKCTKPLDMRQMLVQQ